MPQRQVPISSGRMSDAMVGWVKAMAGKANGSGSGKGEESEARGERRGGVGDSVSWVRAVLRKGCRTGWRRSRGRWAQNAHVVGLEADAMAEGWIGGGRARKEEGGAEEARVRSSESRG